jgi:hypothetical protein
MKIALLGAPRSGKTVYFSALYYKFRNVIGLPTLTPAERAAYRRRGINQRIGFRLRIPETKLDAELGEKAALLAQRPISDWPDPTEELDKASVEIQLDFVPLGRSRIDGRSYQRTLEIYDPTGEAFRGRHPKSETIVGGVETCDIAVVFLPAESILEASTGDQIDDDDIARVGSLLLLGRIHEILKNINGKIDGDDTLPVCFVVSKYDMITERDEAAINSIVYNKILVPFSEEHQNLMICVCPISVLDPATGNFKALSLEWPFLFAVGGTIFRNSRDLTRDADADLEKARLEEMQALAAEQKAAELLALRRRSLWSRFVQWTKDGEFVGASRRAAAILRQAEREYTTSAGRKVKHAQDDAALARDIWSSIAVEGRRRGVYVLMNGKRVDPKKGFESKAARR